MYATLQVNNNCGSDITSIEIDEIKDLDFSALQLTEFVKREIEGEVIESSWDINQTLPSGSFSYGWPDNLVGAPPDFDWNPLPTSTYPTTNYVLPTENSEPSLSVADNSIKDDVLEQLTVRELNKRLQGKPRNEVARLKKRRRMLKNRNYAENCRKRRRDEKKELECSRGSLERQVEEVIEQIAAVHRERDYYKNLYEQHQHAIWQANTPPSYVTPSSSSTEHSPHHHI